MSLDARDRAETGGRGQTRRQRVEKKEEAIIAAARHIFTEKGFFKTTMAQIALKAGVANGTVYIYFENKEALARKVVEDFYGRLMQSAQNGVDSCETTREKLEFLASHHLSRIIDEWQILELTPVFMTTFEGYGSSGLFELNKSYVSIFDRIVKDGRRVGELSDDIDLWILRDMFFGSLDYAAKTIMVKSRLEDQAQFTQALVNKLCSDIQPTAQSSAGNFPGLVKRLEKAANRIEAALDDQEG